MENLETTATNFFDVASNYVWIAVVAILIAVGFSFLFGQRGREWGKSILPWVIIGAVIVIGAVSLGKFIVSNVAF